MDESNPAKDLESQFDALDNSLGMVKLGADGVLGGNDEDEDEEIPPERRPPVGFDEY